MKDKARDLRVSQPRRRRGDPSTDAARRWRVAVTDAAIAFVIALAAHFPALFGGWTVDDGTLLVQNPHVRTWEGLGTLLTHELFWASAEPRFVPFYRPVAGAAYWASYQLVGASPVGQHAINLLLHALVLTGLLGWFRWLELGPRWRWGLAALCGAHPVTAEVVAYVGGRQDLLGWIATLFALPAVARSRIPIAAAAATLASLLGMLSRESFVLAPPLFLMAALVGARPDRTARAVAVGLGTSVAAALVLLLRRWLQIGELPLPPVDAGGSVDAAAWILRRLVRLFWWPTDLTVNLTVERLGLGAAVAVLAGFVAAAVAMGRWVRGDPLARATVTLGVGLLCLLTAVHLPVVLANGFFADRYAYGAVFAFGLLGGGVARRLRVRAATLPRPLLAAPFAALALLPLTWGRDRDWRDDASLQRAMYATHPEDPEAQLAMGMLLLREGDRRGSYEHCARFQASRPEDDRAALCLATYELSREPALAARRLIPWVHARPGNARGRATLWEALFAAGDLKGVERELSFLEGAVPGAHDVILARRLLERASVSPSPPATPAASATAPSPAPEAAP
jgi:hypothetical protein